MQLKNLTAFGFKSFAERTRLDFQPGITAIVGPNGCGKSNIADAVRWVLGEQSAKALRGGEMADVIFNGTDKRKPLGFAEVSLMVSGVEAEGLKAAGVELSYDEVTLTRRVFRDGRSEYFINQVPCRLKDIQQLFMGTGVGRSSYSIMAQGNITQLLSSKPEDRRLVFEEAAGITRFKAQKREALRKLESTEQNLLRVGDLIREVKRQIGSLQRQAGKARRYKQYQRDLQHLDTQWARHQFDVFQEEIRERQQRAEQVRLDLEQATTAVWRGEEGLAQHRQRLTELERAISESRQHEMALSAETDSHQSRVQFNEERLRELAGQDARAQAEIAEAEDRRLASEQELTALAERMHGSELKVIEQRREVERRLEALRQSDRDLADQQSALRLAQSEAFATAQQLTRVRNELTALDLQKQGNTVRLEKLSTEKIQLEEERAGLEARLEAFARETEAEALNVEARRLSVAERQARLRDLQQELAGVAQALDGLQHDQAGTRSRLAVLEQLHASHEGFGAGALAALKNARDVVGALTDRIRVPDEYVVAVEAALGQHVELVLAEQPEAAQQILADLRLHKRGRASIASLALVASARNGHGDHESNGGGGLALTGNEGAPGGNGAPAGAVKALTVVESEAAVRPLVSGLLARTMIVPDLAEATAAWHQCAGAFDFVTQRGELLTRHGVFTGGATNGSGQAPASILGRKNQITELTAEFAAVQERVNELSRRKGALQSEQTAWQASLQEEQTALRAQEVAVATRQGEFNALQQARRVLEQKVETVVYEIQSLAAQQREGEEKQAVLRGQAAESEARDATVNARLTALNQALETTRQEREHVNALLTEAKVALAAEEQVCASLRAQQRPLQTRVRELAQLLAQRRAELGAASERRMQAETEITESRYRLESLAQEQAGVRGRTADLQSQREELESALQAREGELRQERQRLTDFQEQRNALELELAQKQMATQNLRDRVREKYQVNLDDVRSECITITIAAEGPAKVLTLTPEEMSAAGVSTDWNAVAEQVAALQRRLDEMGPVNLVAIEEYEETEQRHQFLSTQYEDLVKAKEQLVEVINRVNAQTKEMFSETFAKVRENFQQLFVEVFGGGKADLFLVDEGDVLESGIEIVARPPGKQLQSISLLSGGEQTMTAVALLFAIYQVKPSPFCVLDELDAPLDESNINRFIRILQRFLAHSQFIIITHNKRTIAMADVLYGITMQERGVSKLVSVKFHQTGEQVIDHTPAPLEGPAALTPIGEQADRQQEETLVVAAA